jgi:Fe-S-cluster containining protein
VKHTLSPQVERTLADLQAARIEISTRFESAVRDVASASKQPLMCVAGCAHCCHYPVNLSVMEGVTLYRHLVRRGAWGPSLKKILMDHASQTFGLAYEVWLLTALPCPLLNAEMRCSYYSARPLVCRLTLSTGDPHYCHPHRLSGNTSIVPRVAALTEFYALEQHAFLVNGAHHVLMPLSKAVLMAEALVTGQMAFEKLDHTMATELAGRL